MTTLRALPISMTILLTAVGTVGCAAQPPPRPVPQFQAKPQKPPWYPEQPWNAKGQTKRVFFKGKIVFDTARSTLRPTSEKVLTQLLDYLKKNEDISRVRLEGHTDSRASDIYNQGLSERRAIVVADWLVDKGLDHSRLLAVAFGESRPLARNDDAAGRQENRRTEFSVADVGGHRFRGKDPTNGGLVLVVLSKEERDAMKDKGEVPTFTPPPVVVEKDVFKPDETTQDKGAAMGGRMLGGSKKKEDAPKDDN
jgi:OOP family OmpA-OmpF porin